MIAQASGLGMGVTRISRPLRGVGVLAMTDPGMDTTSASSSTGYKLNHCRKSGLGYH